MADKQKASPGQVRIMLWSVPRSLSTVLAKCVSFVEDSLIFFEPYICAYMLGPDNVQVRDPDKPPAERPIKPFRDIVSGLAPTAGLTRGFQVSQCSFKWVKEQLEGAHTDKKFIFCKDMAFTVVGHKASLPEGYRHVFLIRHPMKVFPSWKRSFRFLKKEDPDSFQIDELPPLMIPKGYGFKEMSDLLDHVRESCDQEAIVIDADDLLEDPKGVLSALFRAVGTTFDESLVQWEAGDGITKEWVVSEFLVRGNQIGQYYQNALDSSSFLKPRAAPDRSTLSPDVLRCVDFSMPYYEKLYAQRLRAAPK